MSSLQAGFRLESVRRPRDRFLARSSRGSRSSASTPSISRTRTLGSRAAAERVDLELGGSCGDDETPTSLRKILVVLLLIRGDESVLHSLAAGNVLVVLAGLLEHAMLPAKISRPGLKTLLLYGSCQVASADDVKYKICELCQVVPSWAHLEDLAGLLTARVNLFAGSMRSLGRFFRRFGNLEKCYIDRHQ